MAKSCILSGILILLYSFAFGDHVIETSINPEEAEIMGLLRDGGDDTRGHRFKRSVFFRDDALNMTENDNQTISIVLPSDQEEVYINVDVESGRLVCSVEVCDDTESHRYLGAFGPGFSAVLLNPEWLKEAINQSCSEAENATLFIHLFTAESTVFTITADNGEASREHQTDSQEDNNWMLYGIIAGIGAVFVAGVTAAILLYLRRKKARKMQMDDMSVSDNGHYISMSEFTNSKSRHS